MRIIVLAMIIENVPEGPGYSHRRIVAEEAQEGGHRRSCLESLIRILLSFAAGDDLGIIIPLLGILGLLLIVALIRHFEVCFGCYEGIEL
jgi:hypothetical protein